MTGTTTKYRWPRWLTATVLVAGLVAVSPSCSNRADFVCAVLEDCELLTISEEECVHRVGIAVESDELEEEEASKCLDCIVEHPCSEITSYCGPKSCKRVLEAIAKELDEMGGGAGAAGAAGEGGSP
ncbi:MAG TPA: hypothetical protein VFU02_24935 [Polyangiaceae bacterium]|nr:hypothetical protein [Polyangiaceae bacterium]